MSRLDDLLEQIKQEKLNDVNINNKDEVKPVKKFNIPWMNIFMLGVILSMGYIILIKDRDYNPGPDPVPIVDVTNDVAKYENLYSTYKSQSYNKIAELVENKTINNRSQLMTNTQAILEKAREASLGKLDELDNKHLPEESFEEKRSEVVSYLKQKANGFEKAGK